MGAHFEIRDCTNIETVLVSYSDGAHVDEVEYSFSINTLEAIAVFRCQHFGECVVSMKVDGKTEISEADLAKMADIANAELERIVCDSGCGAVFNIVTLDRLIDVPDGFKVKYIERRD